MESQLPGHKADCPFIQSVKITGANIDIRHAIIVPVPVISFWPSFQAGG